MVSASLYIRAEENNEIHEQKPQQQRSSGSYLPPAHPKLEQLLRGRTLLGPGHTCSINHHQNPDVPWLYVQEFAVILFNCWQCLDHIPGFFSHLAELSACITIYRGHRFDHLAVDVKLRHFPVAASGCSTKSSVFAALGLLLFRATDALSGLPGLLALFSYQSPLILNFLNFVCLFVVFWVFLSSPEEPRTAPVAKGGTQGCHSGYKAACAF